MPVADCGAFEVGERSEVGVLESHPSADLGITQKSPSLQRMPVADCGAFEVGERSEVGVLESHPAAACWDYVEIPLHQTRQTNKINYKQFNTKKQIV